MGECHALGIELDAHAAFKIERLIQAEHELVEWRRTVIRGDRFALDAQLDRPSLLRAESVDTTAASAWT